MIDLGPLGILQVQGSLYLPCLLIVLIICALAKPYRGLGIITFLGWMGTRLIDQGGLLGDAIIASAVSEQMAVTSIAVSMAGMDFILAICVLYFCSHLKLSVLIVAIYGCMMPFYALAAGGALSGATALGWINLLGLVKLAIIFGGGGTSLALGRGGWLTRHSRDSVIFDSIAAWVVPRADLAAIRRRDH
ncbi:MAG: hypothetical protein ACR2RE_12990 [Geminicoccaceae bacterium]